MAGALDQVRFEKLVTKLSSAGISENIFQVICSWLETRVGHVIVQGAKSGPIELANMVFQGTVWSCD